MASDAVLIQQVAEPGPYADMLKFTRPHHKAYCEWFRIDYRASMGRVLKGLPVGYDKLALILQAFDDGYEYAFWLDADTAIVGNEDMRLTLEGRYLPRMNWAQVSGGEPLHYNVGAIYARKHPDARRLFEQVISEGGGFPIGYKGSWRWWDDPSNEQTILNRLLRGEHYRGQARDVGPRWNCLAYLWHCDDPVVLAWHGYGALDERYVRMVQDLGAWGWHDSIERE